MFQSSEPDALPRDRRPDLRHLHARVLSAGRPHSPRTCDSGSRSISRLALIRMFNAEDAARPPQHGLQRACGSRRIVRRWPALRASPARDASCPAYLAATASSAEPGPAYRARMLRSSIRDSTRIHSAEVDDLEGSIRPSLAKSLQCRVRLSENPACGISSQCSPLLR